MSDLNYEAEVKKVYPDAFITGNAGMQDFRYNLSLVLPDYKTFKTEQTAWQSAYEQITHQTKLATKVDRL